MFHGSVIRVHPTNRGSTTLRSNQDSLTNTLINREQRYCSNLSLEYRQYTVCRVGLPTSSQVRLRSCKVHAGLANRIGLRNKVCHYRLEIFDGSVQIVHVSRVRRHRRQIIVSRVVCLLQTRRGYEGRFSLINGLIKAICSPFFGRLGGPIDRRLYVCSGVLVPTWLHRGHVQSNSSTRLRADSIVGGFHAVLPSNCFRLVQLTRVHQLGELVPLRRGIGRVREGRDITPNAKRVQVRGHGRDPNAFGNYGNNVREYPRESVTIPIQETCLGRNRVA